MLCSCYPEPPGPIWIVDLYMINHIKQSVHASHYGGLSDGITVQISTSESTQNLCTSLAFIIHLNIIPNKQPITVHTMEYLFNMCRLHKVSYNKNYIYNLNHFITTSFEMTSTTYDYTINKLPQNTHSIFFPLPHKISLIKHMTLSILDPNICFIHLDNTNSLSVSVH